MLKQQAIVALRQENWQKALALASRLIDQGMSDPEVHFVAGIALLEQRNVPVAKEHLRQAIALDPKRYDFYLYLARACASNQDYAAALDAAGKAEQLLPAANASGLDTLGVIYIQCQAYDRATDAFRRAVELAPQDAGMRFNLGTALTFLGDIEGAENELEVAISLDPHHWRAHFSLSQLRKQTKERNHIDRLSTLAAQVADRVTATTFLNMALAKELEDTGDYAGAFTHCVIGKSAPKDILRYSRAKQEQLFDALASSFPDPYSSQTTQGSDADDPIFIVGMPRTGTTLVDRIISSHPLVQSAGELHNFASAWKRAMGGARFEMFNPAHIVRGAERGVDWRALGEDYVSSARSIAGTSPFFTDKLPHNFLYLGYIACALPNAKIICVRKHPLDTCLSNFRQLFAPESPYFDYSYDLLDIGHYYILFAKLMAHWKAAFPGRILDVQYEALVEDQDAKSREIVSYCGLEWDHACLAFEKNAAPVTSASAVQVRAPMYATAVGRWKRYERELMPLRHLLEEAGIACD